MPIIKQGDPNHQHFIRVLENVGTCSCGRVVEYESVDWDGINKMLKGNHKHTLRAGVTLDKIFGSSG